MARAFCLRPASTLTTLTLVLSLAAATGVAGLSLGGNPALSASLRNSQVFSTLEAGSAGHMCTFRAYQVQLCEQDSASPAAYVQVNTILNPDGSTAVDVRAQRPRQAFNSYQRVVEDEPWQVASLERGDTLTITWKGDDGLKFTYGDVTWMEEDESAVRSVEAWCESAEWFDGGNDWSCASGNEKLARKKNLVCGFPCAPKERIELL